MKKNNPIHKYYLLHIHYLYIYQSSEYNTKLYFKYVKKNLLNPKIFKKVFKENIETSARIDIYLIFPLY